MNNQPTTRSKALVGTGVALVLTLAFALTLLPHPVDAKSRARRVTRPARPSYTMTPAPGYLKPASTRKGYTVIPGYRRAPAYRPYGYRPR